MGTLERRWNLDGRTCAEVATAGNACGSAARSDRTSDDCRCGTEQHELQLSQLPKTPE